MFMIATENPEADRRLMGKTGNHGSQSYCEGFRLKLRRWFSLFLRMDATVPDKVRLWRNTSQHSQGNQANCLPHPVSTKPPPLFCDDEEDDPRVGPFHAGPNVATGGSQPTKSASPPRRPGHPRTQIHLNDSFESVAKKGIRKKIKQLEGVLVEIETLLVSIVSAISTQLCESFHSRRAKLAMKDVARRRSWAGRVAAAVLDINRIG
jgi:hypothetical protein